MLIRFRKRHADAVKQDAKWTLFIRDYQKLVKNHYNILFYIAYKGIFIRRFREDEYLRPVSQ